MNLSRTSIILAAAFALGSVPAIAAFNTMPAPATAKTPAQAMAEMDTLLTDAEKALQEPDSLEPFLYITAQIASRLDSFEMRFGVQPHKQPEWRNLGARARAILSRVDGKHRDAVYFNADSAEIGSCVLLELAGDTKGALRRLDNIKPGGGCGNWVASVMLAVNQQRSGIYQRTGRYSKALTMMESARSNMDLALGAAAPDLFYCRYAFLLEKNSRPLEARKNYQYVVDLYPKTIGDEIARKALTRMRSLIEPDLDRLRTLYVEGAHPDYDDAIFAIGRHRFPDSFDYLAAQLKTAESWKKNRILPALGLAGDPRAIEIMRTVVRERADGANTLHALAALGELGDRSEVVPYLQQCVGQDKGDFPGDGGWLDNVLRQIYNDGPPPYSLNERFEVSAIVVAKRWLAWIEAKKDDLHLASRG